MVVIYKYLMLKSNMRLTPVYTGFTHHTLQANKKFCSDFRAGISYNRKKSKLNYPVLVPVLMPQN